MIKDGGADGTILASSNGATFPSASATVAAVPLIRNDPADATGQDGNGMDSSPLSTPCYPSIDMNIDDYV